MTDRNQNGSEVRKALSEPTARGDVTAGVLCLLLAAAGAFWVVPLWVYVPRRVAGTIDSPAVMPLLMLALLGLFGAVLLADKCRQWRTDRQRRQSVDWRRAGGMVAICSLYLAAILAVGLPLATGIALIAAMLYFGERRWRVILPVAVITPLLLWAFFAYVALVPMPQPLLRLGALGHDHSIPAAGSLIGREGIA